MRTSRLHLRDRQSQQGLVFYAFVLVTIFVVSALFWAQTLWQGNREARDLKILQQARDAVLAHLAAPELDNPPNPPLRRLGQLGALPDLAFTGLGAPLKQCAYRTWIPGAALVSAETSGAAARCFGRLPWQSLGVDLGPVDSNDIQGRIPWLIVSPNLAVSKTCMPNFTPLVIGSPVGNTCPAQLPFPWLTVVDERGNVLSNRVAFALIMPGPPAGGPARNATAAPGAWLNALKVNPGCPAPCVPGNYNNAAYQQANGVATTLIATNLSNDRLQHLPWLANPSQYQNRVLWVSVDEMFRFLEARSRRELNNALKAFKAAPGHGYFPYAASFNDVTGACTANLRFGHPPVANGNCGLNASLQGLPPLLQPWWTDAGWQQYFIYAASPTCVAASSSCGTPGLTLNASNGVNALLIGPGSPITSAPFAPSRAPQAPLSLGVLSPLPADYIDSTANVNGGATGIFANVTPTYAAPNDDRLDIVQ